jgi:hypothetical protein
MAKITVKYMQLLYVKLVSASGLCLCLILNYALQSSRLIVRSGLDVPTFATRRLHACHQARAPGGGRWKCGREMSENFAYNVDFHVTFRDLLHAVRLRRLYFPSAGIRAEDFFVPVQSRVRTRKLGYQSPARYL